MVEDDINEFINKQQSLQLACISPDKLPHVSYTPFIYEQADDLFYIYISNLAEHGKYLPTNNHISIMLIEDEQICKNIFARRRLNYLCSVSSISRNDSQWNDIIEKFEQQFGKIMQLLSQFSDFNMYALKPENGSYVQGFGKAFQINNGKVTHIDESLIDKK